MAPSIIAVVGGLNIDMVFETEQVPNVGESMDGTSLTNHTGGKGANAAIYGIRGGSGVMVVTTKQTATRTISTETAPGILSIIPKGFYKAREFYSPQYDAPGFTKTNADNRTTIYWNPNVITDKNGNATFDFFNADGKGPYRVVVEGIDDKGNVGRQVFKYKVE